mmetsp:Transcript_57175/g.136343  ORF Transcript_57175/g.136343 Transcript_57175/m.136343 type:complete len:217 (-) Transcript_57175:481-1131(-)
MDGAFADPLPDRSLRWKLQLSELGGLDEHSVDAYPECLLDGDAGLSAVLHLLFLRPGFPFPLGCEVGRVRVTAQRPGLHPPPHLDRTEGFEKRLLLRCDRVWPVRVPPVFDVFQGEPRDPRRNEEAEERFALHNVVVDGRPAFGVIRWHLREGERDGVELHGVDVGGVALVVFWVHNRSVVEVVRIWVALDDQMHAPLVDVVQPLFAVLIFRGNVF